MTENNTKNNDLQEIRSIMERSTKFISLSGLSGIMAGIIGIISTIIAAKKLDSFLLTREALDTLRTSQNLQIFLLILGIMTLMAAVFCSIYFTLRRARQKNLPVWDNTSQRFLINLFLPLMTGGIFTLAMAFHNSFDFSCSAMLIFFGLSLINASKYTHEDIYYLGIFEILLGLAASVFVEYSILLWGIGFGLLNIIYGTIMYKKFER